MAATSQNPSSPATVAPAARGLTGNPPVQHLPPRDYQEAFGMEPESRGEHAKLSCKWALGQAEVRKTEHGASGRDTGPFEVMPEDEIQTGADSDCAHQDPDQVDRQWSRAEDSREIDGGHKLQPRVAGAAVGH